jgi:rhodanese-related sulfurtransferase
MSPVTVDELLRRARSQLERVEAPDAAAAMRDGAVIVDIRSDSQRAADGIVPGARVVARNVLEWRCDPASEWRDPVLARPELRLIVMCNEGYQSSLAAATLKELGLPLATDLIGGFQAWRATGLAVEADRQTAEDQTA